LQVLELYEIPDGGRGPLSVHGPNVSSLTLTRQPASGLADLFPNLEEFVIAGPFWGSPLPTLPNTLMHIRLQAHAFMSDSLLPAIAAVIPSLARLRAVSIEEALTTDKNYPALREVCEVQGVEILVNPIPSLFTGAAVSILGVFWTHNTAHKNLFLKFYQHPYLAEMDRFPRQFTFSEFFDTQR